MIEIKSKNEIYVDKRNRDPLTTSLEDQTFNFRWSSLFEIFVDPGLDGLGWSSGSVKRKLDSRWTLIQENEMDLIFVDENEIIYPKRINVDKRGLVDFSDFLTDDRF